MIKGKDTGFLVCKGTVVHREEAKVCPNELPPSSAPCTASGPVGAPTPPPTCSKDEDCGAGLHGRCQPYSTPFGSKSCSCFYGCTSDAECQAGQICRCGPEIGACIAATCKSDADCGAGSLCLSHAVANGCSLGVAFACSTPQDQCLLDSDCPASSPGVGVCGHDGGKRTCIEVQPCAG